MVSSIQWFRLKGLDELGQWTVVQKHDEINIIVDRAKIVSLLTALQMRKLTREQTFELEGLLLKERNRAIEKGISDMDIILGYYLVGLNGYVEGGYYPREQVRWDNN